MPVSITIPHPHETGGSIKGLVFTVLAEEHPLTMSSILSSVRRRFAVSVTYQGVRKAVEGLADDGVITRDGRMYELNREWLSYARSYLQSVERAYLQPNKPRIQTIAASKGYKEYRFSSLYELDLFWTDVLMDRSARLAAGEPRIIAASVGHLWWMLLNLGNELKLNTGLLRRRIGFYMVCDQTTPLDRWALAINRRIGVRTEVAEKRDSCIDTNVIGNHVIQVRYPQRLVRRLDAFYKKYSSIDDMSSLELSSICHEDAEITFKMLEDESIATAIRERILQRFKQRA